MNKTYFYIIFLFIICQTKLFSQVKISGQITDKYNKSIEFLEIQLQNKDSIIVKSELTNVDGKFTIITEKGEYQLLIKQLGKIIQKQKISVNQDTEIGIIQVKENQQQLKEVVVNSKKKLIERKVDRLIFNIENSITASGGNAIDALKITPSIRIQKDNITMVGKNNMSVMIDDKLIQLSGDELISFLQNIPSESIKNIEVITTPPAKYSAEGNSGLVNIKMKKAKKDNFSGNLKTSYTQAKYSLGNIGGGLNYQKNKTTIISNINYTNGRVAPNQEYTINYPNYTWLEESKEQNFKNNLSGRINIDYQATEKTTIGFEYSGSIAKPIHKGINQSNIINNFSHQLDSLIVTPSYMITDKENNSFNFHTITKLDTIGKKINFDIDYFKYNSNTNNNFNTNTFFSNGQIVPNRLISGNNLSNQNIKIYTSKLDFDYPINWLNLSFGAKISLINNDSDIAYFNTNSNTPLYDPTKSNIFNYKERTGAIYFSGSKKFLKKWESQIGLRLESTKTKGYSQTINQSNENNYLKLFPTFYLTYNANENSVFSINYSKRIDRPSYSDLNPFRFYSTSYNYSEGNPFLKPFFTENFEISNTYKNWYTSIYYINLKNGSDQVTYVSPNSIIQYVTPLNFYNQKTIGASESYTLNKWKWLESNNQLNIFYVKTSPYVTSSLLEISSWTGSFNSNNILTINKKRNLKAEIDFTYQSPSIANSYKLSSFYEFNFGIKMPFLKKKFDFAINIEDAFKTNKQYFNQVVNNIRQDLYDYNDTRKIRFSIKYNFGKSLKREKRDLSNEEETDRTK